MIDLATKSTSDALDNGIDLYLQALARDGWTRKTIYRLVLSALHDPLPEPVENVLDGFYTALNGDCHKAYIIVFPGEPTDESEFLDCVYGQRWLE